MNHSDKTKEELISELEQITDLSNKIRKKYEEEVLLLKQSEGKIRKKEELFRKAFMVSPDSVNINRLADGLFVSVNKGFTEILGFTEEEVIGKTSIDFNIWADPGDRSRLVIELEKTGLVENFEADFQRKDGSIIKGSMSASLIDIEGVLHILNITKDITTRKLIEKELAQEKYFVDALMNNLEDYIYIKDCEGRFLRINKAHAVLLGLDDPDQVIGKTDYDFYSKEDADMSVKDEQLIVNTGQTINIEERLTLHGQPVKWVLAIKMPLHDHEKRIIGTFGISRDVTEKKNLEDKLHLKQVLLEAIVENSPDQIFYKDRNSRFVFCNKPVALLAGCVSEEEMIGKSDSDFYPENLAQQFFNDEKVLMDNGVPLLNHEEYVIDKKTGEKRWNLTSKVPVKNSDGTVMGLAGFNREITVRKRTELENQVLYEINQGISTTNNIDDLLSLIHHSLSQVVYADNCFVALFNKKTGLFSFPYFIDKCDPMPLPTKMEKSCTSYVFRNCKPYLFTNESYELLVKQNEVELIGSASPSWIGIPLKTPSDNIGVLVLQHYEMEGVYSERDQIFLTSIGGQIAIAIERKMAEDEIKIKNELLEVTNAEKDKFFSIIAHDLRGPMSAFVAVTQILTEDIINMTLDEIRDITVSMKTDATNIYNLLENLLEWSKLKRGIMEFNPQIINVPDTVKTSIEAVSVLIRKKSISLVVNIPDRLEIAADKHMFETIVRNLISNSVKFTPAGGEVIISAVSDQHNTKMTIIDNGIGMSPDILAKLFHLNEKTSRPGTDGEPSTGLGLLLCKEFIDKHSGTIWAQSEVGKGSTFSFTVPACNN